MMCSMEKASDPDIEDTYSDAQTKHLLPQRKRKKENQWKRLICLFFGKKKLGKVSRSCHCTPKSVRSSKKSLFLLWDLAGDNKWKKIELQLGSRLAVHKYELKSCRPDNQAVAIRVLFCSEENNSFECCHDPSMQALNTCTAIWSQALWLLHQGRIQKQQKKMPMEAEIGLRISHWYGFQKQNTEKNNADASLGMVPNSCREGKDNLRYGMQKALSARLLPCMFFSE